MKSQNLQDERLPHCTRKNCYCLRTWIDRFLRWVNHILPHIPCFKS